MVKVSVVVPVYNQEMYIERCLDSILAQTLRDIEVIIVDDGSTDRTSDILYEYAQRDDRIIVLHQQNMFAGAARNNGLRSAQGEYVIFWDSDDYFAENGLEVLYDEIKRDDADICVGEAIKMDMHTGIVQSEQFIHWKRVPQKKPFNINDIPQYIFNFARNYPWNRLYKRAFLVDKNLQFSELKQSNDVYFVMKAFVLAEKITVVDNVIVYYQFRNINSLSGNALVKKESALNAHLEVKDFLIESGYWEDKDIRQSFINNAFATITSQFALIDDYEEYKALYSFYKEKALPMLGIGNLVSEQMYSDKNAYELANMLTSDANEYIFKQYVYYRERNYQSRVRIQNIKDKLQNFIAKNLKQEVKIAELKDKLAALRADRKKKKEKIQKQREKIESQKEKIQNQREEIQNQKNLLNKRLVKVAVKIQKIFM